MEAEEEEAGEEEAGEKEAKEEEEEEEEAGEEGGTLTMLPDGIDFLSISTNMPGPRRSKAEEKGRGIGDFGGGSIEQLRPWMESDWLGPTPGVSSCTEPPGAPRGAAGAELGRYQGGHFGHAPGPGIGNTD